MGRRVTDKYTYSRHGNRRQIRPLLVVGCEGETEKRYSGQLAKRYGFTATFVGPENKWARLLEKTRTAADSLASQQKQRPVIPVIIVDIEIMSDAKIAEALRLVAAAKKQGVEVFINRPKIEQWFALHTQTTSEYLGPEDIDRRLSALSTELGLPDYRKPGSIYFHQALTDYTDSATNNCNAAGHSQDELPCLCGLVDLLKNYSPLSHTE